MHGATLVLVQLSPILLLLILKILDMKYPCRITRDRAKKIDHQYASLYQEVEPRLQVVASTVSRAHRDALAEEGDWDDSDVRRLRVVGLRPQYLPKKPTRAAMLMLMLLVIEGCLAEAVASSPHGRVLHVRHASLTRRHVDRRRVALAATTA